MLVVCTGPLLAVVVGYLLLMRSGGWPIREPLSIAEQESRLGTANLLSNRVRVLVAPEDPARGADEPLVALVAFVDFRNPSCRRTARMPFEAFLASPSEVRVVVTLLSDTNNPDSVVGAETALVAAEQGKRNAG